MNPKYPTLRLVFYLALVALFIGANIVGDRVPAHIPLTAALWAVFVIRTAEGPNSVQDVLRLFITIVAANAAAAWTPTAGLGDLAKIAGLTSLIIPAYLLLIWLIPSQRPAHWGLRPDGRSWLKVLFLLGIWVWNFGFDLRDRPELALISGLAWAVLFLNVIMPNIAFRQGWMARVMAATSLPLGLYAANWPQIVLGHSTPMQALGLTGAASLLLFILAPRRA